MAIDTADKRSSAIHVGIPWRGMFPVPDGSVAAQADRQHIALVYRGILAAAITVIPPIIIVGWGRDDSNLIGQGRNDATIISQGRDDSTLIGHGMA